MNILDEIKTSITQGSVSISDILRKTLELAYILNNDELKNWVNKELDGYDENDGIPDYRKINCESIGNFNGPFGSGLKNYPIPSMCLPPNLREQANKMVFVDGIKTIESMVQNSKENVITFIWPANIIALCQDARIYENMSLVSASRIVGKGSLQQIIDQIKTRLLRFILELSSKNPSAETDDQIKKIKKSEIEEVYESCISGSYKSTKVLD
ncbi:MAG TPA: hypothetical protein PLE74_05390 [Candidatus Cloacimonadota bacterium]|nr:hypothetical protein [Candidatus Cloacimonadota bacterium]HPT71695.1 hypothetical protein [Candidatus Cloacimonadota bacterium]